MPIQYVIQIFDKQLNFIGYYQSSDYPNDLVYTADIKNAYNFSVYYISQFLQNIQKLYGNIYNFMPEKINE